MIRFLARGLLFSLMALLLASCDSGNDSVDVPGLSGYTLTVQTVDSASGLVSTVTSDTSPLRVQATLTSPTGTAVTGATITFGATAGRLGTTSAQTDGTGVASVLLYAGTTAATGATVTASFADPDANVASDSQTFTTQGNEGTSGGGGGPTPTNVLRLTLAALDGSGAAISAGNKITASNGSRLVVNVTLDGVAVPNALVTFSVPGSIAGLAATSAATDAVGRAEVAVTATAEGAGSATASVTYGSQTASSSVVISTAVAPTAAVVLDLGNLASGTYADGALSLSSAGPIAQGSTITVRADVVDSATSTAYDSPVTVSFRSACASQTTPTAQIDAQAITTGGRAEVTYRPISCTGTDTITATLLDGTRTLTATASISINAPNITQIAFVSATPSSLALSGTGGMGRLTQSQVKFRVTGDTGSSIPNQLVCFGLSTTAGGLSLNASSARTNSAGEVVATVQAGSVPTSVRVQASVDTDGDNNCATVPSPTLTAVSDALSVSTGLPHQKGFSIALSRINPPQAWTTDGVEVEVTVFSSDHFNNPVPDGTAISFWTELGSIESACTTVGGTCSVTWRSQSPRYNQDLTPNVSNGKNDRLGRTTIVAYAVGEESFSDTNGNGRFDAGEPFGDLAEVVKDSNENGVRSQPASVPFDVFQPEEFVDFNGNSAADAVNGKFDGVLCGAAAVPTQCSGDATVNVRASTVLVLGSPRDMNIYVVNQNSISPAAINYELPLTTTSDNGRMTGLPAPVTSINVSAADQTVDVVVVDENGNAPAVGTKVEASIEPSSAASILGAESYTVPNQTEYFKGSFTLTKPDGSAGAGSLVIKVTGADNIPYTRTVPVSSLAP